MNRLHIFNVQFLLGIVLCLQVQEGFATFGGCRTLRRERRPINMFGEDNKQYFIINDDVVVQNVVSNVCLPDQPCARKGTCDQVYKIIPLLAVPADDQDSDYQLVDFKFPDGCKCKDLF